MRLLDGHPDHPLGASPEDGLAEDQLRGRIAQGGVGEDGEDRGAVAHLVTFFGPQLGVDAKQQIVGEIKELVSRIPCAQQLEKLEIGLCYNYLKENAPKMQVLILQNFVVNDLNTTR